MKTHNQTQTTKLFRRLPQLVAAIILTGLSAAPPAFAANGTWTNAPVDANWANTNNWSGRVVPGQVNNTGNNAIDNSVATFNTPLFSGMGGAANPISVPSATVANGKGWMLGSILFSNSDCGAYVFSSPDPAAFNGDTTPETGILNLSHNGSVTLAPEVNNSQTFLLPVGIRLPSSTAGIFNFINNSTNLNAVLFFNAVSNHSANTRGTTFVLGGSNRGTNTIAMLSKGTTTSGAMGLTKQGTGTWILSGANDLPSQSANTINNGTLIIKDNGGFGASATVTVISNGVLQLDNVSLVNTTGGSAVTTLLLKNGGTVRENGSGANYFQLDNLAGTVATVTTTGAGDVLTVNTNRGGASDTILHVTGPGTVVLNGSTYAGKWSLDAGTVQLGTAAGLTASANVSLAAGVTLDVSPLGATIYTLDAAALSASGAGTGVGSTAATIHADAGAIFDLATGAQPINLTFNPASFSGDAAHPALYVAQGTLSLGGNPFSINNVSGTPLGVGTYVLIQQANGDILSGGGYGVSVSGSGLAAGTVGAIQVSGGQVNLVVSTYTAQNLVWQGGNNGDVWDAGSTANWLNGGSPSIFNNSDNVTFNATGAAHPTVNLTGTLIPGSVTVDTSGGNYTFAGSGVIVGPVSLTKNGSGTLTVQNVNTYSGGTVINNGTVQLGNNNAAGVGDLTLAANGALDLNNFNDLVGGLNGSGVVDSVAGGSPTLTIGNNDTGGNFSGTIRNTSGTVNVTKTGNGVSTLSGSNSYAGATTVNAGTLRVANYNALGAGNSAVTVNAGTLDLAADVVAGSIAGSGAIANNSSAAPVTLTVQNPVATTFNGNIVDGSGGGAVGLKILNGASLTLAGDANTFSGGVVVGSGSTFAIPNAPAAVGGFVIASNTATLALSGGSGTPGTPTNVLTVAGASVSFTAGALGKIWGAQFAGSANSTNRILNQMSFGGDTSFKNFNGVISLEQVGSARFINIPSGAAGGGDAATFAFVASGSIILTRDAATVRLGAVTGGDPNSGIDTATGGGTDTYILGGKNVDSKFNGFIRGLNNVVKTGTGTLTFNGGFSTNITSPDGFTYETNIVALNLLTYTGNTTISNGVLAVNVPNLLTNSPNLTLASASAVLDATAMGYVSNEFDFDGVTITNQLLVTNGVLEIVAGQSLSGLGTIRASKLLLDEGSALNVGLPAGTLTISGNAELAGAVNFSLDRNTSPASGTFAAQNIIVDPAAALVVTNAGAAIANGDTFTLFNQPVNFTSVTLPATDPTGTTNYVWENDLGVNGTIKLTSGGVSPVNPNPTNLVAAVSGNTLALSWPADHTGWYLQMATDLANPDWVTVPDSQLINATNITIDPAKPSVFYRLSLQP